MATMSVSTIAEVREFNRFYTRVLGLLRSDLAGSPYGLTEARVLYELAQRADVAVTDLRDDLDLDAGYLSRILTRLAETGLVARAPSTTDGRRQRVSLTAAGERAFAELDSLQTEAIDRLLTPLDAPQRAELVAAMDRIRRALSDRQRSATVVLRAPEPGDLGWVIERHGARYAAEYGWDHTFEALVARVVADFAARSDPARSAAWIAEIDGERVGCVFCTLGDEPSTAQLRLLLVEPSARGSGLGTRLVDECVRFARRSGYSRMTLWTNDVLSAARNIYARHGFTLDRREAHHSFGHDLVGEYWSRDL